MSGGLDEASTTAMLQSKLKALGNRYAAEILQVLNPSEGDIISSFGWDEIVEGILSLRGILTSYPRGKQHRTQEQAEYEKLRTRLTSGGTLYESMSKLVKVGFVQAAGERRKKQRRFMITHEGRLALAAVGIMHEPSSADTEVQRAAKILLKHKNFVSLLPAQEKFIREIGEIEGNLVIQMPPGSGKTFLAMIAILLRLQRGIRCLYLTPYTSLSRQIMDEYGEIFRNLGFSAVRHDGHSPADQEDLRQADLVVAIYESFASAYLQEKRWTKNIGLVVVDELTELDSMIDQLRAADIGVDRSIRLDCVITLLKRATQIVTLSSRFGETNRVARWLQASVFRPSARIMPDEYIAVRTVDDVEIYSSDRSQRAIVKSQDLLSSVMSHMGDFEKKSILVVVGWRYGAESVAERFAEDYPHRVEQTTIDSIVSPSDNAPTAQRLRGLLARGTAFHHAGLDADIRARLERAIKTGYIKTVVSTTGITSGTSFPFDSVIILFSLIGFKVSRSKYLQIAGRIGEYYLAERGGSVYLLFDGPTRFFESPETLEYTLLHEPLHSLKPGPLFPQLMASLVMRKISKGRPFKREKLEKDFIQLVSETFRAEGDQKYVDEMRVRFGHLFDWLIDEQVIESRKDGLKIQPEARAAVLSGVNIIEFVHVRERLQRLDTETPDNELLELVLDFALPRTIRPKTVDPYEIELRIMNLEPPGDWYRNLVIGRERVKLHVLEQWINESNVDDIIRMAAKETRENDISLDEGDLKYLVEICSAVAENLADYLASVRMRKASRRMWTFSRQLRYGVREDLAETDLFEVVVPVIDSGPSRSLTRAEVRILSNQGYHTVENVVKKDIDAEKAGLARDRFAANSGLPKELAKEIYKAALAHYRSSLGVDQ
ncbi:MAG: DEAD/DEAH box helicase [Candidatus Thorarchaeota archaeon]|nr:MAG: DEAD/DEAH box helicase [Candidatus Thorarchaeota archaeon]